MTCPNVAKVVTNLQNLVIGILYQVHKKYLKSVKVPPGLKYFNNQIEFWVTKLPIEVNTLHNTLQNIAKALRNNEYALSEYQKNEFLSPPAELVTEVRQDLTEKKKL